MRTTAGKPLTTRVIATVITIFIIVSGIWLALIYSDIGQETSEPIKLDFMEPPIADFSLWAEGSTVKIRPYDAVNDANPVWDGSQIVIKAARNEYEPFQLVITAGDASLVNVSVYMSDELTNSVGHQLGAANITMFRVWYINCSRASDRLGDAGEWPDALIPFVNPYEPYDAIGTPFDVPLVRNQPVWVRLYVPEDAAPGIYNGNISVSADNAATQTIPLRLEVWDFTLPEETHIKAIYGVEQGSSLHEYFGVGYDSIEHNGLRDKYYDLLADNRLSPGYIYYKTPEYSEINGNVQLDFGESNALYSRLLDEKHVAAFGLPFPWDDMNECYIFEGHPETTDFSDDGFTDKVKQYYSALYEHFEEKGWIDKHYVYVSDETGWVSDEPFHNGKDGYERVINWSNLLHAANADLKFVVMDFPIPGAPYWPDLRNYADIWDPYMEPIDTYPKAIEECQAIGKEIWTATNKYADYIDYKATMHRSIAWFAYKYDIDGLDQWDTTFWWRYTEDKIINPWQDDPVCYDGNGGGAMIYPGKAIGVNGPISTIRLELSRESVEDYEYLYLLEQLGGRDYAKNITTNILPYEIMSSEAVGATFYDAREAIAAEILALGANMSNSGTISGWVTGDDTLASPAIGALVSNGISGAITDADGRYSLSVQAGENVVTVSTPAMKSYMCPVYYERYLNSSQTVYVNAGEQIDDIDFGLAKVQKNVTLISSFEDDIANWTVVNAISQEQSTEHVTDGNYSYKVVFDDEVETDMYIEYNVPGDETFEALEFEVHSAESEFAALNIYVGENWEYTRLIYLAPNTSVHISVPVSEIEAQIALQGTIVFGLVADNIQYDDDGSRTPLGKKTLYFDGLRFTA